MGRYFVAVHPPGDALDAIAAIDRPELEGVRWTDRHQWHVTLAFLGDVDVDATIAALEPVDHPALRVSLGPDVELIRDDVAVLPARGLDGLAASVREALLPVVPDLSMRRYRGHLTLARSRNGALAPVVGHACAMEFEVTEFSLISSELDPRGARHTAVARFALRSRDELG